MPSACLLPINHWPKRTKDLTADRNAEEAGKQDFFDWLHKTFSKSLKKQLESFGQPCGQFILWATLNMQFTPTKFFAGLEEESFEKYDFS